MNQSSARRKPVQDRQAMNQWLVPGISAVMVLFFYFLIDWSNPEMFVWNRIGAVVFVVALFVFFHLTPRRFGFVDDSKKATVATLLAVVIVFLIVAFVGFSFEHIGKFLATWILVVVIGAFSTQKIFETDFTSALAIGGGALLGSLGVAVIFVALASRLV